MQRGKPEKPMQGELFEVFVRANRGLDHVHVGSLRAADSAQALEYARETYLRRGEGASVWVVRSDDIAASQESDVDAYFDPLDAKPYRHAASYVLPDGTEHM